MISNIHFTWKTLQVVSVDRTEQSGHKFLRKSSCKSVIFLLWMLLSGCYFGFIVFAYGMPSENVARRRKALVSRCISLSFSILTYCALFHKRYKLMRLKHAMEGLHQRANYKAFLFLNILQILNLIYFLLCPLVTALEFLEKYVFMDGVPEESPPYFEWVQFVFSKYVLTFYSLTYPLYFTFIFASLCSWCTNELKLIERVTERLNMVEDQKYFLRIFQRYRGVLDVCKSIEDTFSTPIFFLITAHFVNAFVSMQSLITGVNRAFYFGIQFCAGIMGLTILMGFASEIPKVVDGIKMNLCALDEKIVSLDSWRHSRTVKLSIEAALRRQTFVLSACNMVYFRRPLIIASYGTLISFGFLIMQYQ